MAKIGDTVRFLNTVGGGRIVKIDGNIAYVEDADGFEVPVLIKECVVVASASAHSEKKTVETAVEYSPSVATNKATAPTSKDPDIDISETEGGDVLNIVIGYEPSDLKHLNSSTFDTYLINDSNYYLYFSYMSRSDTQAGWTTRYAGVVEPNIQVLIDTITGDMLPNMDHIAFQYIAFKQSNEFALKNPALVEFNFDTTKFFKLHCFHDNAYFDNPVIAYDIVLNDRPQRQRNIDGGELEKAMKMKRAIDRKPIVKRKIKQTDKRNGDIIEIDLHINELIDNTNGLSAADILNLQIDEFRRVMDANLKNRGQRIVFIHGKGEGVLRNALMKELNHRYKGHTVQDASFREYGFGATQVTI